MRWPGGAYFCWIVAGGGDPRAPSIIECSLPHLSTSERCELMAHYLGCIIWKDLCQATGVDYSGLPGTVEEALARMEVEGLS